MIKKLVQTVIICQPSTVPKAALIVSIHSLFNYIIHKKTFRSISISGSSLSSKLVPRNSVRFWSMVKTATSQNGDKTDKPERRHLSCNKQNHAEYRLKKDQ